MIQVTLTFFSLSDALRALREIPESALNAALTDITPATPEVAPEVAPEPAPKPALKKKPSAAPVLEVVPAPPTAEPEAVPLPGVAPGVDYPVLQAAVLKLAARDRDATLAIAQKFGVKTFKELSQDRWAEAYGAVTATLAELETV